MVTRSMDDVIGPFAKRNLVVLSPFAQDIRGEISSHSILFFALFTRITIAPSVMRTAANKHQPNI
jgi:hypothetical protein